MRWLTRLAVMIVALPLAVARAQAPADDISGGEREAIRRTIAEQIAAFRRDDASAAYAFASPAIQEIFPSPDIFMTMVRQGYAAVHRPREFAFGDLVRIEGALIQLVDVIGPDGAAMLALYEMQRQPDGSWRINGCRLFALQRKAT